MTVLLGLPDRLKAVRIIVTVEARRGWGAVVRGLPAQCGAVVVVPPAGRSQALSTGKWTDASVAVLRDEWKGIDNGRRLMGIDVASGSSPVRAAADELLPDIVVETQPTPGWPHQWALHGVIRSGTPAPDGELAVALADAAVSLVLLQPGGRPEVAGKAGPSSTKPWFAVVDNLEDAKLAVDAGATRLAWRCTGKSFFGRPKPPGDDLLKANALLTEAWRRDHPEKPTGKIPRP